MRRIIALIFAAITLIILIFAAALTPNFLDFGYHSDKTLHLLAFFLPMLAFTLFNLQSKRKLLLCASILCAMGISIEIAQLFSASRATQWEDLIANFIGVFLGYATGYLLRTGYYAKPKA